MRLIHTIAVLGGDARQRYLAGLLRESDFTVRTFAVPGLTDTAPSLHRAVQNADAVCLPTPAVRSGSITGFETLTPAQLLSDLGESTVVFGGGLGAFKTLLQKTNTPHYDFLQSTTLALENAALTAEGALCLALQAMPEALQDAFVLVTGFGRIGKSLARKLRALGANGTSFPPSSSFPARPTRLAFTASPFPNTPAFSIPSPRRFSPPNRSGRFPAPAST